MSGARRTPSPQMGAVHRSDLPGEANPRTRSGALMLVEILDRTPARKSRLIDHLPARSRGRARGCARRRWSQLAHGVARAVIDPDFDLLYHLRRVRVPEPGDRRTVLDMAEAIVVLIAGRGPAAWWTVTWSRISPTDSRRCCRTSAARRHPTASAVWEMFDASLRLERNRARADAAAARPGRTTRRTHPDPLGHIPPAAEPDRAAVARRSDRCDVRRCQPGRGT